MPVSTTAAQPGPAATSDGAASGEYTLDAKPHSSMAGTHAGIPGSGGNDDLLVLCLSVLLAVLIAVVGMRLLANGSLRPHRRKLPAPWTGRRTLAGPMYLARLCVLRT
jgi:hypothetical protein